MSRRFLLVALPLALLAVVFWAIRLAFTPTAPPESTAEAVRLINRCRAFVKGGHDRFGHDVSKWPEAWQDLRRTRIQYAEEVRARHHEIREEDLEPDPER